MSKHFFWPVNLVLIATIAYLSTRVGGTMLGTKLIEFEVNAPALPKAKKAAGGSQKGDQQLATKIVDRNIFNSNPPSDAEELASEEDTDADKTEIEEQVPPGPDDPCDASAADLKGSVTMVASPAEWSMAVLTASRKERLVKVGDLFEGTEVVAIHRHRVVLRRAGQFECVYIEKQVKKKSDRSKASPSYSSSRSSAKTKGSKLAKIRESITKKGPGQYEVERSMLDEQLEDLSTLSRQARVIPHYVKGKTEGFKIVGVRPNSLYSELGIRSGDILKGVNGEQISSPTKALEFLEALKTTSQVTIDIERRNQKKTFEYEIK